MLTTEIVHAQHTMSEAITDKLTFNDVTLVRDLQVAQQKILPNSEAY